MNIIKTMAGWYDLEAKQPVAEPVPEAAPETNEKKPKPKKANKSKE